MMSSAMITIRVNTTEKNRVAIVGLQNLLVSTVTSTNEVSYTTTLVITRTHIRVGADIMLAGVIKTVVAMYAMISLMAIIEGVITIATMTAIIIEVDITSDNLTEIQWRG